MTRAWITAWIIILTVNFLILVWDVVVNSPLAILAGASVAVSGYMLHFAISHQTKGDRK